jgi:hypothetical protein
MYLGLRLLYEIFHRHIYLRSQIAVMEKLSKKGIEAEKNICWICKSIVISGAIG